ncbi:hypothetical protein G7051_17420 [Dysgonomonas sp. HDW5B]|uniref:hypothetical protein n=1 Tax=Dysgonomonas sp. HDW5B TaxID=2714927 RepID=UPI00140DE927|nr:hypothetical protein [Dysgonomonas sp. HDW5B]QIK56041.1 hypothetical protein G7051_17420 [Dysgonomonas sp. HDW5B]
MVTEEKTFTEKLTELKKFLADRELLGDLETRSGAKYRTVHYAFTAKSKDELKGKRLKVFQQAVLMRKEIDELFVAFEGTPKVNTDGAD